MRYLTLLLAYPLFHLSFYLSGEAANAFIGGNQWLGTGYLAAALIIAQSVAFGVVWVFGPMIERGAARNMGDLS